MALRGEGELVFVVAVSSFTKRGFTGSASYRGTPVDIQFDDMEDGVFLTPEMCKSIGARKGSRLVVVVDSEGGPLVTEAGLSGEASRPRISNAKIYYDVGREGGAVIRVKRA